MATMTVNYILYMLIIHIQTLRVGLWALAQSSSPSKMLV
jgi:hypothetical protein